MSFVDSRGVSVSTHNTASLWRYERAVELSVSYVVDPFAEIQAALEEDPSFVSGHCFRAGLIVTATDRTLEPMLKESVEAIESAAGANPRERAHAAAARAWLQGDFAGAIRRYGDILLDYPRDLLALQVAHVGDFFLGASTMLRDRIAQVLPHWSPDVPGFSYVLGMYAFGLEETALYARAEDTGRRALDLNPRDPWAVHAVTHVMEMQGRVRDGIEWLRSRERDWAVDNLFSFHNWWHLALYHLDLGDTAAALDLYDRKIRPAPSQTALEMIDAAAMLWRLHLRGIDVGDRWQEIATAWEPFAEHGYYAFNDVHAVMAFVGAQRFDLARRTIASLERRARDQDTNAMMSREVGLPLAKAFVAFGEGRYEETVELITPIRTITHRFGGSHAQRDLLHLTLIEAALRSGRGRLAYALGSERTQLKPTSPFNWQLSARALTLMGDASAATRARDHAEARRKAQLGVMAA